MTKKKAAEETLKKLKKTLDFLENNQLIDAISMFNKKCSLCEKYYVTVCSVSDNPCIRCPAFRITKKACTEKNSVFHNIILKLQDGKNS